MRWRCSPRYISLSRTLQEIDILLGQYIGMPIPRRTEHVVDTTEVLRSSVRSVRAERVDVPRPLAARDPIAVRGGRCTPSAQSRNIQ